VIHGIPSRHRVVQTGDIVGIDLGINLGGYFTR
jgi:methionine aminopeptidase